MCGSSNMNMNDLPVSAEERDALLKDLSGLPLALCVSGGADSTALMQLVADWAACGRDAHAAAWSSEIAEHTSTAGDLSVACDFKRRPEPAWLADVNTAEALAAQGGPPAIVVLTVNHGLRREAADEALFVAEQAARLGFAHQTLEADERPPGSGIQAWGRSLRYRLMIELLEAERLRLRQIGASLEGSMRRVLVTAHHLDDQAETFLMRLARGSGLAGLAGMKLRQTVTIAPRVGRSYFLRSELLRPLLRLPKGRLIATLREKGAPWLEDPSNADVSFERVRIRQSLSQLGKLGISTDEIARSAFRLREAESSLSKFEIRWHQEIINWNSGLQAEVALSALGAMGGYAGVRILQRLFCAFGGAARPAGLAQIEGLYDLLLGSGGAFPAVTLGGCRIEVVARREAEAIVRVFREVGRDGLETTWVRPGCSVDWDGGRFRIGASLSANEEAEVRALGSRAWAQLKREVPGIGGLGLAAGAMATLPSMWQRGALVAVPVLCDLLADIQSSKGLAEALKRRLGQQHDAYRAQFAGSAEEGHPGEFSVNP
jgi:tRNA(Ile)-lysidine synthase